MGKTLSSAKGKEAEANVEGGVSQVGVDTRPDNVQVTSFSPI